MAYPKEIVKAFNDAVNQLVQHFGLPTETVLDALIMLSDEDSGKSYETRKKEVDDFLANAAMGGA